MGDKQCIHYWKIDERNIGRCCYCGAVKDFGALLKKEPIDQMEWLGTTLPYYHGGQIEPAKVGG